VSKTLSKDRVFALKGYTVRIDKRGKFFVCPSDKMCLKERPWSGPYKTLHHATTAIARKLSRELTQRNGRLQQWDKEPRP
jgi:hypothetical protein